MTPLFFFPKIHETQYIWDPPPLPKKMPAPLPISGHIVKVTSIQIFQWALSYTSGTALKAKVRN